MTPELRELFRLKTLQLLESMGGIGMRAPAIQVHLRAAGLDAAGDQVRDELLYLQDKALVAPVEKLLSPENHRWRITAAGRDFIAAQGLA